MDKLIIEGRLPLVGEIHISGAKNAALPILVSSLLSTGWNEIHHVPDLGDVQTICALLAYMGVGIEKNKNVYRLCSDTVRKTEAPYERVKTMRASILVLGPLLARWGQARVSLPGGCAIGLRPINLHLAGLQQMGADIAMEGGYVVARASVLKGARIFFETVTVTGTENLMMAAVLAKGTTVLENAAREPEVGDLAKALIAMGARIEGVGTDTILIEGVPELHAVSHHVMSDRIETGTLLMAVAAVGGRVKICGTEPQHLQTVIQVLREIGVSVETDVRNLWVKSDGCLAPAHIQTEPYPGFPTDLQAQLMSVLTQAPGESMIIENIFENRFHHVGELTRLGATIQIDGRRARILGGKPLNGAPVMATDLRASAALVIAGLVAQGTTEISHVYHLDRGYERLDLKLKHLGAQIQRITSA